MKDIKRMKLYHHPHRIYNELNACGFDKDNLSVEILSSFDQYHYMGTDSVDEAIQMLEIDSSDRVIDVGSGIGGPARYLADKTGCHVTALELQEELNQIGSSLTERCGLSDLVEHRWGNILDFSEDDGDFDFVVSWLAFLHIPERQVLFDKCSHILKNNGEMFIEDFYKLRKLNEKETKVLAQDISCEYLPKLDDYKKQLQKSGFTRIEFTDKTDSWKNFVRERMEKFIQTHNHQIEIHNTEIVDDLEDFYKKMSWLFERGNLGGVRIIAKKG
jgi:cyclopropane fatty-acyl-phospholipid synthase-like methyltransferase